MSDKCISGNRNENAEAGTREDSRSHEPYGDCPETNS